MQAKKETSNEISFFVVRSTGIEDIRRYEKSLDFQGFFAIERQNGRQKQGFLSKNRFFDRINMSNIQKIEHLYAHFA